MKTIILAAGRGSRLGERTKDRPKCMCTLLGRTLLEQLPGRCLLVDLASVQGIDLAAAESLGLPNVWARSLPGRLSPRTAAAVIRDAVYYILLEERGDPA